VPQHGERQAFGQTRVRVLLVFNFTTDRCGESRKIDCGLASLLAALITDDIQRGLVCFIGYIFLLTLGIVPDKQNIAELCGKEMANRGFWSIFLTTVDKCQTHCF